MKEMNTKTHIFLLTALAAVLFLANLGGYDLWPPDEPRFAQVAREMVQTGDYLVPRVNGLPYKEKPPLLFWAQAVCATPFGDVTEVPARLPSALAGIVTILLTYCLVARLFDRRAAFWAALILMTTQRFWWQARFGHTDMLLTACVTASFLFLWLWHRHRRDRYLIGFYLSIAAGVYAKGPPAIIFPVLAAVTFFWKQKAERKQLHLLFGLVGVAFLIAVWLIPARMAVSVESPSGCGSDIATNLFRQTIGRFFLGVSHANPPWYYLVNLPLDLLPWSLFLPWTLPWVWRKRKASEEMRFLLSWTIPAFIFFSICIGKRGLYLLPMYPAFAGLLAQSILELMDSDREHWRKGIGLAWGTCLMFMALAPFGILLTRYRDAWSPAVLLVSACGLVCAAHTFWVIFSNRTRSVALLVVAHASLIFLGISAVALPLANSYKSAKAFCAPLRRLSHADVKYDLYSLGFSREEYIYYSEHFHTRIPEGLLEIDGARNADPYKEEAFQAEMLHVIQKAVEGVPVKAISNVSDEEVQDLRDAIEKGGVDAGLDAKALQAFETAMTGLLDDLLGAMLRPTPSFVITQEEDWRWVAALCPGARAMRITEDEYVGSRHVLLVANESAYDLMK